MVNCSSSGLRSLNRASPSTWSNGEDRQAKGGGPSCVITRRILPPWKFFVPTIGFDLLYAFVIVRLDRRDMVWINVPANPTAEWVARQITEAFPWDDAPKYMIRDRDQIYGAVVTRRLRAMGIRDKPAFVPRGSEGHVDVAKQISIARAACMIGNCPSAPNALSDTRP